MDAKPQRPTRAFPVAVHGNENAISYVLGQNQRNKSTGPARNMLAGGGPKAPASQRSAFVDLTNHPRQRDGAPKVTIPRTDTYANIGKENDPKGAFFVPPQRAKPIVPITDFQPQMGVQPKDKSAKATTNMQTALAVKNGAVKKVSLVYGDHGDDSKRERIESGIRAEKACALADLPSEAQVDLHELTQHQYQRQSGVELEQPKQEQEPVLRRTQSRVLTAGVTLEDTLKDLLGLHDPAEEDITEAAYVDAVEDLRSSEWAGYDTLGLAAPAVSDVGSQGSEEAVSSARNTGSRGKDAPVAPTVLSEMEEYWDDDEEFYEDPGYTTAHSYRSVGDNTTGGPTTVIVPKVTAKIQKELDAARIIVASNMTEQELEDDAWDVSMVAEYGDEIYEYMRDLESRMMPDAHYMDNQTEIQWSMRSVLMEWLVQVHGRFGLLPETLFLTVNYIDRFLSSKIVSVGRLQLVGATAIFIAAKYEEINCPSVQEIVFMVDGGYEAEEILKAERFMLSLLGFELGFPGPMSFLRRISKADEYDLETRTIAKYFLEVTIMDERFVGCPPSFLAAGAHCIARLMLKKGDWSPAHVHYSGYTWSQIRHLVTMILECCQNPRKHHLAVYEKYTERRFKKASLFVQNEIAKGFTLPTHPLRVSIPNISEINHMALPHQHLDAGLLIPIEG